MLRWHARSGLLWACLDHQPFVEASVHADNAEMVMRIAEAKGLPFTAGETAPDWLHISIGTPPC